MTAMLAMAGITQAANNKLVVQDMQLEPGNSVTMAVVLENETTNLMGFQCDIVLPEGLSLKLKANGKPAATLGGRFEETACCAEKKKFQTFSLQNRPRLY